MIRWGLRALFLTHRWLGIVLALLMAVWAVSGIVMMYVSFPETTESERLSGLEPLDLSNCCTAELPELPAIDGASIEMLQGTPVLRWYGGEAGGMLRLADGQSTLIGPAEAAAVATAFQGGTTPPKVEVITRDQWTVYGRFRAHAPLYKASFADDAGTVLYVSGRDGTVVQDTTRHERFWNWLGAVPHWLYFTALRENVPLWSNIVIYASVLGTFLTVTGLYLGIHMFGRGKRKIPYRGIGWWHHVTGLIFGVLTLLWVVSGLFSMNPWGWMEGRGAAAEAAALAGRPMEQADLDALVSALQSGVPAGTMNAELAVQDGNAVAILSDAEASRRRASLPGLAPAPMDEAALQARTTAVLPGVAVASQELIHETDAYYYGHKSEVPLPVWRAIYGDEDKTRLYFNPQSGELVRKIDGPTRAYRWLHLGLHRWDFSAGLRTRPAWDVVVVPLMIGVSVLCLIGVWIGFRRLGRTFRRRRA